MEIQLITIYKCSNIFFLPVIIDIRINWLTYILNPQARVGWLVGRHWWSTPACWRNVHDISTVCVWRFCGSALGTIHRIIAFVSVELSAHIAQSADPFQEHRATLASAIFTRSDPPPRSYIYKLPPSPHHLPPPRREPSSHCSQHECKMDIANAATLERSSHPVYTEE